VKRIVQNSGIHLLLLLYCFALFSFSTSQAAQIDQLKSSDVIDECRASRATSCQVYSNQLDLQLKTFTEKKDNSFHKKNIEKLLFTCYSDPSIEVVKYKVKGPKDIIGRCFSQTDIIYPFHSFW
jgi:hypothetical protein